jgi:hypothetical protein
VPYRQLIENIWIPLGEIRYDKSILSDMLNDLARDQAWFGNLVSSNRVVSLSRDDWAYDMLEQLVGPLAGLRVVLTDRGDDKTGLLGWRH